MIKALIGKKLGMTTIFDSDGIEIPVTLVEMGPCTVVQVKKADGPDGYNCVQIGYDPVDIKKLNKPMKGHYEKKGLKNGFRVLREFATDDGADPEPGSMITAGDLFEENTKVKVIGTSKGAGFAGGMKRHGFHGAPASHGAKRVHRRPMSAGATDAQRVFKGKRSPGHMGDERVTIKNLEIVKIKPLDAAPVSEPEPEILETETQAPVEAEAADQVQEQAPEQAAEQAEAEVKEEKKDKKKDKPAATKYIVAVKGAVPGKRNSLVIMEKIS